MKKTEFSQIINYCFFFHFCKFYSTTTDDIDKNRFAEFSLLKKNLTESVQNLVILIDRRGNCDGALATLWIVVVPPSAFGLELKST